LEKSIEEHICSDGRLHGQFFPLRKDDAGTVTGRWSGANPNLQQIPRNDKVLGPMARGMFVCDEGCWYGHTDYSQVEYRVFSHYARGWADGDRLDLLAQKMRADFVANPHMDYHQYVIDLVKEKTGKELERSTAKRVNFGTLYFMGEASLSKKFNIPYEEACEVFEALFHALPFIESTRTRVVNSVKLRGYLTTFCGRRQRIGPQHVAEGSVVHTKDGRTVVGINEDGDKYYPFFNYLIQGTAADIMKFSLVEAYKAGVYDVLKLHLLVHDETGTSIPKTLEGIQAYQAQQDILSNTVKLKVPILAEADFGPNWGTQIEGKECDIYAKMREEIGV
jgi:DNA polymerase-1